MKMAVFWDIAALFWYKFTGVSEVFAASMIRLMNDAGSRHI
jgi:predicted solute-binding protein